MSDDLSMSPFELNLKCTPKSPLDILDRSSILLQNLEDYRVNLKFSLESAKFAHKVAKDRQAAYVSRRYKITAFKVC